MYCFPYSSLSFCFSFHHFLSTPLFPLIIPPSAPSPPSFCHLSLPFSFLPFGHSVPWSSTPSFPPQPFFWPLFKIQQALSGLTLIPCHHPLCLPHLSISASLIPLLSNPNKPVRTFLCGGYRGNTPHVRLGLNINISQFEVLEKDTRRLTSPWVPKTKLHVQTQKNTKLLIQWFVQVKNKRMSTYYLDHRKTNVSFSYILIKYIKHFEGYTQTPDLCWCQVILESSMTQTREKAKILFSRITCECQPLKYCLKALYANGS